MNQIDQAIMNALLVNMGYNKGEKVRIMIQGQNLKLPHDVSLNNKFAKQDELALRMLNVYRANGIDSKIISYIPDGYGKGIDVTAEGYFQADGADIIFAPTVFSITHTDFKQKYTENGGRIATMPTFTLDMFEEGGPMSIDYATVHKQCEEMAEKLMQNNFVYIKGIDVDMHIEIDHNTIRASSGILDEPGKGGNLPGAETYCSSVHLSPLTFGHFVVKKGWGGGSPLEHDVMFIVKEGKFTDATGFTDEGTKYAKEKILPTFFEKPGYNILAELGIGLNPNVTPEYINKVGWSTLLAEKIVGTVHFANGNNSKFGGINDVDRHEDWVVKSYRKMEFKK